MYNSALYDRYFRTFSGNTQVNATELRAMRMPDLRTLARIGARVRRLKKVPSAAADRAVLDVLGIRGVLRDQLSRGD